MSQVWEFIRHGQGPDAAAVADVVRAEAVRLGRDGFTEVLAALTDTVLGAGQLQKLLDDPTTTDVLVNGGSGVWVDNGSRLLPVACDLGNGDAIRRLAVRLAGLAGRRLDDACPHVDGVLPGGVRLHAILPPLVEEAAHISLRVPRRTAPHLRDLVNWGAVPPQWSPVFRALIRSRTSFVVTGGAGTGKTTLLAALLAEATEDERIVVVEDVRELTITHPHVVRLQTRAPNVEQRGAVDLVTLVRQSLRMRPDRLVVGEVRGSEVRELLSALNTGHEGGCGTVHANGTADVVARFEALGALAGLSPAATRAQLVSAVQVVVHLRRYEGRRYVESMGVLRTGQDGFVRVIPALLRAAPVTTGAGSPDLETATTTGSGWPQLRDRLGLPDWDQP